MPGEDTNRYPTDPLNGPAAMAEMLRGLEQRVSALEGAPLVGTSVQALDENGAPLVTVGTLSDGARGIEVRSEVGDWALVKMTTAGWVAPHVIGDGYDPAGVKTVTSGSFAIQWGIEFGDALGPGVEIQVPWATGAGTTGEVQISSNGGGATVAHTLAAASSGFAYVRWLHDLTIGSGPAQFFVEVRRSAGAGTLTISPCHGWVARPDLCSSAGNWV